MHVAVTAVGRDRPGIVAAVTRVLLEHGGNIEDSRMAILGGHFAMMLIVALPEGSHPEELETALAAPARDLGLMVSVRPVAEIPPEHAEGARWMVSVYGADRPGIVYRVTQALADRRFNVIDLATHVIEGTPPVYVMIIEGVLPSGADAGALERDLEALAADLGVDLSMHPADADAL